MSANNVSWTDNEVKILIENYRKLKLSELIKMLPGRSKAAIYRKASSLLLRVYNSEDFYNLIFEKYKGHSLYDISNETGINWNTLRYHFRKNHEGERTRITSTMC